MTNEAAGMPQFLCVSPSLCALVEKGNGHATNVAESGLRGEGRKPCIRRGYFNSFTRLKRLPQLKNEIEGVTAKHAQ